MYLRQLKNNRAYLRQSRFYKLALFVGGTLFFLEALFGGLGTTPANAAFNEQINYQGKLTNSSNVAVADGTYNMRFWLLTSPSAATTSAVWTEELTGADAVQVTNGLFSIMLGSTTALSSVDFSQTLYLGVEIGGSGGSPAWDGEMSPRKILGAVPAAFEANNAAELGGVASTSFLRSDEADTATGLLTFTNGFISSASSTISGLTTTVATTTTFVINGEQFTDLTGTNLINNGGTLSVSTTSLNIAIADTTGTLSVARGGTGLTTFGGNNTVLYTTAADTLASDANFTYSGSTLTVPILAASNATATSTLAGGLNVGSGGFVYDFASGNVGVGTASPGARLDIDTGDFRVLGNIVTDAASETNTFVGVDTGTSSATHNTFLGYNIGLNATGGSNTFLGSFAGTDNTIGTDNTFVGYGAGNSNTEGLRNTFIGQGAGQNNEDGALSTYLGYRAGYNVSSGADNILLGYQAGDNLTIGDRNIVLGYDIDVPAADSSNVLNIGNLIFGTSIDGTGTTLSSGNIGIGTTTPDARLNVLGSGSDDILGVADSSINRLFTVRSNGQINASSTATSTFANGINIYDGCYAVNGTCLDLGGSYTDTDTAAYISGSSTLLKVATEAGLEAYLTDVTNVFTNNDTITDANIANDITIAGGTIGANNISGLLTTTGTLTIGDGGDRIDINSNTWDVANGVFTGGTWQGNTIASQYISTTSLNIAIADTTGTLGVSRGGTGLTTFGGNNTILYTSAADMLASNANFVFDGTNLGIGSSTPTAKLTVQGTAGQISDLFAVASSTGRKLFSIRSDGDLETLGDTLFGGTAAYKSSANLSSFQHAFADRAYVDFQDNPEVKNGKLTHIDFDDQGDSARGVWGDGNFVYLANYTGGLHVYSVDETGTLTHIDSDDPGDYATSVWGDGNFVYLANGSGGLYVYSVDETGTLTRIDGDDPGDIAWNVWGDGNFVYLANHTGGLHVYSVDDSGTLTHIDSDDQGDNAYGVWGDGNFVYLANYIGGLHVYSVDETGTLTHIDSDDQGGAAMKVWGDGNFIYLANSTSGLHTYSVSSTGTLSHIDSDDQGDAAYDVWGDGNFIYLANNTGGLHTYSVNESGTLTHIDFDNQGDNAHGVWGDSNFIYLANQGGGLHTYSVDNAYEYDKANEQHLFVGDFSIASSTTGNAMFTYTGTGALVSSSTATSTFANGINIYDGCFAVNGVCLDLGGSYSDTNTAAYINSSTTIWNNTTEASLEAFLTDVTNVFTNNDTITDANIANDITIDSSSVVTAPNFVADNAAATSTFAGGLAVDTSGLVYDFATNNVGIGTAHPNYLLHVSGSNTGADANTINLENTSNTAGANANFRASVAGSSAGDVYSQFTVSEQTDWIFGIDNSDSDSFKLVPSYQLSDTPALTALTNGYVGFGSTTPTARVTVQGSAGQTDDIFAVASSTGSKLFTIRANGQINASSTATSTFANGIDLEDGCFAVNGVCIGGGGGGAFTSAAGYTTLNTAADFVGIATATPSAKLTVQGNAGQTSPLFMLASSTGSSLFSIASDSLSGFTMDFGAAATTTIYSGITNAWSIATSSTATSIFSIDTSGNGRYATTTFTSNFVVDDGAILYDAMAGETSIENLRLGPVNFDNNAGKLSWIDMIVDSSAATGTVQSYTAQLDSKEVLTIYGQATGETDGTVEDIRVVIGTSSDSVLGSANIPDYSLIVAGGALCVDDNGASNCDDAARTAGQIYAESTSVTQIDVAENYPTKDSTLGAGDIVMFDPENEVFVSKYDRSGISSTTDAYLIDSFAGVISTAPGLLLGGFANEHFVGERLVPLTLTGRVPVKVNFEGGDIRPGDRISFSSVPGIGAKATTTGVTVGVALGSYTATATSATTTEGLVTVFVDSEFYHAPGQFEIDRTGAVSIGTTTDPNYKLKVGGDVAATAFINISASSTKKDIEFLSEMEPEKKDFMGVIRGIDLATYHYDFEESSTTPKRLGLIAELAPEEVLSSDRQGVDLYKLISVTVAGVQDVDSRLTQIELDLYATSTEGTLLDDEGGIMKSILDYLASVGVWITDKATVIANLVADDLTVGSTERPSGITLYDEVTGAPYCLSMKLGEMVSEPGKCAPGGVGGSDEGAGEENGGGNGNGGGGSGNNGGSTGTTTDDTGTGTTTGDGSGTTTDDDGTGTTTEDESGDTASSTPDTTEPVIMLVGAATVEVLLGDAYVELGANATDDVDGDLSDQIVISGDTVDTSTVGTYTVVYDVSDASGNESFSVTRTVNVVDPNPAPPEPPAAEEQGDAAASSTPTGE